MFDLRNKHILITGGAGSFGKACAQYLLQNYAPQRLVIFNRDELKQHEMRLDGLNDPSLCYSIGDVRDFGSLRRAMDEVNVVIHTAALKHDLPARRTRWRPSRQTSTAAQMSSRPQSMRA